MITLKTRCLAALGAVLLVGGLAGCVVGPTAIAVGRGVYNEIINRTEDEQLLNMIVRERYSETYGMLVVASVTANIRASVNISAEFGLSRALHKDYDGNLVPLAGGVAFEENPTISYVPRGGAKFVHALLSPISLEESLLMAQYVAEWRNTYFELFVSSINDVRNPVFAKDDERSTEFRHLADLWSRLTQDGAVRYARNANGENVVVFRAGDTEQGELVEELLELTGISARPSGGQLVLPLRFTTEEWLDEAFNFQTPSVMAILRAAANCIEIPDSHLQTGIVEPGEDKTEGRFLRIRTSRIRPRGEGAVAVRYRDLWYYVDDRDPNSKRGFRVLRMLFGLRLHIQGEQRGSPVLTIPVG